LEQSAKVLGLKSEQKSIDKILEGPGQVADLKIQKILQKDFKKVRRGLKKSLHTQKQNQHVLDIVRFNLSKMTTAEKKKFETKLQSQVEKIQKKKEQARIQSALYPPKHKPTPPAKGSEGSI
jgi:peptidyl-tRNA hydrolase